MYRHTYTRPRYLTGFGGNLIAGLRRLAVVSTTVLLVSACGGGSPSLNATSLLKTTKTVLDETPSFHFVLTGANVANGITPQTLNNSTQTTGAVDLSLAHRAFFALYLGALSGGASINATLQVSPDNSTWSTAPGSNVSITAKTASSNASFDAK